MDVYEPMNIRIIILEFISIIALSFELIVGLVDIVARANNPCCPVGRFPGLYIPYVHVLSCRFYLAAVPPLFACVFPGSLGKHPTPSIC